MPKTATWTRTPEETARSHGTERDLRHAAQMARDIADLCEAGAAYFDGRAADGGPLVSSEYHRQAARDTLAILSNLRAYLHGQRDTP